ncbi:MAG: MFS transporter [Candidatus Micrarchaeia archaeon]
MPNKSVEGTFKFLLFSRAFRSIALIYMSLAFSLYLHALKLSIVGIGLVAGATMLFMIFLIYIFGYIGDRRGFKTELIISESISFIGALLIALSTSVDIIILGMVIAGLTGGAGGMRGAFSPGTNAYIANNFPDENERVRRYSLVSMTASLSAVAGSILFSSVSFLGRFTGILLAYRYFFALASLLLGFSTIFLAMLADKEKPKKTTRVMKSTSLRYSLKIIAINSLGGIGMGLFMPLLPLWFELAYKAEPLEIGTVFTLVYLFTAIGSFLSSRVYHKLNPLSIASYTRMLSALLLFGMAFSPFFALAALLYVLRAIIAGFGSPSRTAINVRGIEAEDYGTATSVQGIASRIAQLSSGASGYLMDLYLPLPLFLGSIFQFASGLSYKLLLKQKK